MNLILFGFKGCGKTTLGKALAARMRRPFIDTDDILSEIYTQNAEERLIPRDLYRKLGEAAFRVLEKQAIFSLGPMDPAIIAVGGGAVLDPDNVEHLKKWGQLVYVQASADTLKRQIMRTELPAFLEDTTFESVYQIRKPIYEAIQARRIDVDVLGTAGAIAALCSILILEEPTHGF